MPRVRRLNAVLLCPRPTQISKAVPGYAPLELWLWSGALAGLKRRDGQACPRKGNGAPAAAFVQAERVADPWTVYGGLIAVPALGCPSVYVAPTTVSG
ncbi:hypothetical protein K491DRAFT_756847, partial [Lophiostoma macrostomum CBS 122681]